MRIPSISGVLQVSVFTLLAACSPSPAPESTAAPDAGGEPQAAAAPPAEPAAAVAESQEALFARASAALAAERLFAPAGDNALELYLQVLAADAAPAAAGNRPVRRLSDAVGGGGSLADQARQAINDLRPYALAWVRQLIESGEFDEARRGLDLLARVPSAASSLEPLERRLADAQRAPEPAVTPAPLPARSPAPLTATRPLASAADESRPAQAAATPAVVTPRVASEPANPVATQAEPTTQPAAESAPAPAPVVVAAEPMPALLQSPAPRYPPRAQRQKIEGWVSVAFVIRPDGSVANARVTAAEPEEIFDSAAIAAIERWKYQAPGKEVAGERTFNFMLAN